MIKATYVARITLLDIFIYFNARECHHDTQSHDGSAHHLGKNGWLFECALYISAHVSSTLSSLNSLHASGSSKSAMCICIQCMHKLSKLTSTT